MSEDRFCEIFVEKQLDYLDFSGPTYIDYLEALKNKYLLFSKKTKMIDYKKWMIMWSVSEEEWRQIKEMICFYENRR